MAKLSIVRPQLTEDDVISEIKAGNVKVSDLMRRSGLSRAVVRRLVNAPKGTVKPPARPKPNPVPVAPPALKPPEDPPAKPKPIIRWLLGGGCLLTALAFAAGNAFMNLQFGMSFGHDESSRAVLGGVGLAVDLGALLLFATAGYLWEEGHYGLWPLAVLSWAICLGLSGGAALGFASGNIADSLQARDSVMQHRQDVEKAKKHTEAEREAITETGDPQLLDNEMRRARVLVPLKNWGSSKDCTEPTVSADLCRDYNRLKDAKTAAEQRIYLDAKIRMLSTELAALAPISSKDPGADQISQMAWGAVTAEQVRSYLVRGLALIISISPGFLLAFARALLR